MKKTLALLLIFCALSSNAFCKNLTNFLADDSVTPAKIDGTNEPAEDDVLFYKSGDFTWSSVSAGDSTVVTQDYYNAVTLNSTLDVSTINALDSAGLTLYDDGSNLGIYIEDLGDVGVGTSNPTEKLHVVGTVKAGTPGVDDTLALRNENTGTLNIYLNTGGDSYIINNSLGIGLTNPSYELDVVGTINATNLQCDDIIINDNAYGSLLVSSNAVATAITTDVWTTVTINVLEGEITKNISYTSTGADPGAAYLTGAISGVYKINVGASFFGSAGDLLIGGPSINDADPPAYASFYTVFPASGYQSEERSAIFSLNANDTIRFKIVNKTSGDDVIIVTLSLSVERLGPQ